MPNLGTTVNNAHKAFDNIPSMLGVIGTLGTADTTGTALTLPIAVDPTTGALFVQDLASSGGTQPVSLSGGTFNLGTVKITDNGGNIIGGRALSNATPVNVAINDQQGNQLPSIKNVQTYGTTGALGTGTIVAAAGNGTFIYVQSFSIDGDTSALGTPDIILSFGTVPSGQGVIFRGALPTTTPFGQSFAIPVSGTVSNLPLTIIQTGTGTMSVNVSYFTGI